jgi:hypothetical protein
MPNQGNPQPRDVKPGHEKDQERERQEGHTESAEQPGSTADISKQKQHSKK